MHNVKKLSSDLYWIGANDRRLSMFEGVYSVPRGVSYNSYLIRDESTVLLDTVDRAVAKIFFENLDYALDGRALDYIVVQHMEPDHSATLLETLHRYPAATVVCSSKSAAMIEQFTGLDVSDRAYIVGEGSVLNTGRHELSFYMAPMVHWPEVMVSYDRTDKALFSADAFGCFGALNGAIYADEVDFFRDYLDDARRYYANIVGKYGQQVKALLKKAAGLDVALLCPLHGFVWRENIAGYVAYYEKWSAYEPEKPGVMIAYASIYGNTENAAELLSSRLREAGVETAMYDVSVTPASEIVAAALKWSHLVFASPTYNAGIFISMDELLRDIAAHNLQNRTLAFIENGSWAPTAGKLMRGILEPLKGMRVLDETVSIKSSLKPDQLESLDALAAAIAATLPKPKKKPVPPTGEIDKAALFSLSYGLFVLTTREGEKDNGCIINTVVQLTDNPKRIAIGVNRANYSNELIKNTGLFNLSVLTEEATFEVFKVFGFSSGRDTDKFAACETESRTENGLRYIPNYTNAVISCRVVSETDYGTHTDRKSVV